jgi:hypothetical protein
MQELGVLDHLAIALFNAVLFIIHLGIIDTIIEPLDMLLELLEQFLQGDNVVDTNGSLFVFFRALVPNPRQ